MGRIIAVGGGKGGVGKSLVSTNLAVALARTGARVVVLDADLGAPNMHTMFGILRPQRTVEDFLAGRVSTLDEITTPTSVPGLQLICGAEGALGSANPTFDAKQRLLAQLARLPADCLIIDVGAGVDLDTIDFFNAADTRLVVMVPEITSLQNGYSFLKMALFRRLQRAVAGARISERIEAAFGGDAFEIGSTMDRVSTFFSLLEDEVPELVPLYRRLLEEFNAQLVGNMLHRPSDGNALYAMARLIRERLGVAVEVGASLRHNAHIRHSVNAGTPFAASAATNDPDGFELTQLATKLRRQDLAPLRKIREDFVRAMQQRPRDPDLDLRFPFGLESIQAPPRRPAVVAEPRPVATAPAAPTFSSEFRQLQRVSPRVKASVAVELNVDGRWYLGRLVELNEGGGKIAGMRVPGGWPGARGMMRVVEGPAAGVLAITVHSVDAANASVVVRFVDAPAAARTVRALTPGASATGGASA